MLEHIIEFKYDNSRSHSTCLLIRGIFLVRKFSQLAFINLINSSEHVLNIGNASWSNWGLPNQHSAIYLFIAWTLSAFAVAKGVKSVGKVVYFTATFPFVILTALLIRGLTLPGSSEGIMFYITPQWERLAEPGVWGDASSQIFYSFSLAVGALITLASYNKVKFPKI